MNRYKQEKEVFSLNRIRAIISSICFSVLICMMSTAHAADEKTGEVRFVPVFPSVSHTSVRNGAITSATGNVIRNGFDSTELLANDDGSAEITGLGFTINFFGTNYSQTYVNNNGNLTFDNALGTFTPEPFSSVGIPIIAPFWADVDTRAGNLTKYGTGIVDGHLAFGATWVDVGYYSYGIDKLNSFQVVLIDRSDIAPGNFDIEYNYEKIQWETGGASGGSGGLGGTSAYVGYTNGSDITHELPGSGVNGALINGGSNALISNSNNSGIAGRYRYYVREGGEVFENDLAIQVDSERKIFDSGDNNKFTVTINNLGDTQINDAQVTITHDSGFEKLWLRDFWYCHEDSEPCTPLSTNTDGTGATTATFRVSVSVNKAAFIVGHGEFESGGDGVRVTATVSGGAPSDSNPDNDSDSMAVTIFPPDNLPGIQLTELCDGLGRCEDNMVIDKTKPTVVLTHGLQNKSCARDKLWTDFRSDPVGAGNLLNDSENLATPDANVLQYFWKGACHGILAPDGSSYIRARKNVYHAAEELAKKLKARLGSDYGEEFQFIGHSLGTAVNAYASRIFLEEVPTITTAQITILDYPNRVGHEIPGLSHKEEVLWGFDDDFFSSVLPFDLSSLTLKIDNYYGRAAGSAAAVGTSITAPIAIINHELTNPHEIDDTVLSEGVSNDHSGVHQWYRWTIRPKDSENLSGTDVCSSNHVWNGEPFILDHDTLDPCKKGWNISSINPQAQPFDVNSFYAANESIAVAIEFAGGEGNNCTLNVVDGSIQCGESIATASVALSSTNILAETLPPVVSYLDATMTVPVNARYLTFDYRFTNVGDGDYVYLLVDDKPIWMMSGDAVTQDVWNSSGPVTIAMEPGDNTLVVALYGVGAQNAQFEMKNFQFIEVLPTFADVPPAHQEYRSVEALADASIVEGCNVDGGKFCPDQTLTRDTLALWLMKAKMGESYVPDAADGLFDDVPTNSPFAAWIEAFKNDGYTEGCWTSSYCPNASVDKAQLAKLLLITQNGSGYTPDSATGDLFDDVGVFDFNADWIEDAVTKDLLEGCGYKQFCPDEILSRSAMARIIENAF